MHRQKHTRRGACWLGLLMLPGLSLGACTLAPEPTPEVAPAISPLVLQELAGIREELGRLRQDVNIIQDRMQRLDPLTERVARLEMFPALQGQGKKVSKKRESATNPAQIVLDAQRESRVQPSERGYFGKSAEQVYTWQPGRVFVGYLSWSHPTLISLPPGERAIVGLALDKESYDVLNERAGMDLLAHDVISIRPKFEQGEVDGFLVTESGRRYLFHFIIGKVGMLAITFETPSIQQAMPPDPTMLLPRSQSTTAP